MRSTAWKTSKPRRTRKWSRRKARCGRPPSRSSALERKRAALIGSSDRAVAAARLHEAEADVQLARRRMADTVVRSPMAGVVYSLPIRQGAYLNAGDLVANVGVLEPRARARVRG